MCGIVGLLVKKPELRERLGELMVPMLIGMTERGPDSAGLAVFTEPVEESVRKISLYSGLADDGEDFNWQGLVHELNLHLGAKATLHAKGNHAVLSVGLAPETVKRWIREHHPKLHILSTGRAIDLYKDVGTPAEVSDRYEFSGLSGTHLVGHTRMATESAVTPDRAHPFTAGEDFCLVHNGSLSNPYMACAASWSRTASASTPTTTPKPRAATSNAACVKATTSKWRCKRASSSSTASTRFSWERPTSSR